MAAAPEAPEGAGVVVLLGLSLLAFLGWISARGLGYAWRFTIGGLLTKIGDALPSVHVFSFHADLGAPFKDLASSVTSALERFANQSEAAAGYFFHTSAWLLRTMATQLQDAVFATERAFHWMAHVFVPTYVHGVTDLLHTTSRVTVQRVTRVERVIVHVPERVKTIAHAAATVTVPQVAIPHVQEWDWITRHWKALRRVVVGAEAGAAGLALPGWLSHEWFGLTKRTLRIHRLRISRLEKILGAAGMAALMANALGLSSWRCITRGNLGRVSRAICGLSLGALNDLLGLLTDLVVLTHICDVISLLEDGFGLISGPLNDWIGGADAMFVHCGYDLPGKLPETPPLDLPPLTGVTLSLP